MADRAAYRELLKVIGRKLELTPLQQAMLLQLLEDLSFRATEIPAGGSTGEVLTKSSDASYDVEWA